MLCELKLLTIPQYCVPFRGHILLSIASIFLHFTAFLLLFLVGLSTTIIKSIYLVFVHSAIKAQPPTSIATELRFGVWGVCAKSVFNTGECFGPKLGYDIPQEYFTNLGVDVNLGTILLKALQFLVVLHVVAAVLAFLALIASPFLASQPAAVAGLSLSVGTGLVATAMLIVDLALVIVARNRIKNVVSGLAVDWGNGVWMVLTAVICTWAGIVILAARTYYLFGVKKEVYSASSKVEASDIT